MRTLSYRLSRRALLWAGLSFHLLVSPALHAQVAGSLDPSFSPDVGGQFVLATAVQPDGKILIGGVFDSVNGEPRSLIARLHPDGTLEGTNTFNPQITSGFAVSGIIVQPDGKIIIAGNFSSVNGEPRGNIARLHADGLLEGTATFNPGTGANDSIIGMALQADGRILIGGFFSAVNGKPRSAIARLNADGTVEIPATFNPGAGVGGEVPLVRSIAVQRDGKILIGGYFDTVDGQPRTNIARLHSNGAVEGTVTFDVGGGINGNGVDSIAVQPDGRILVGGTFTMVDDQTRKGIARLTFEGAVEVAEAFNIGDGVGDAGGDNNVYSLALQADGKILLGGAFSSMSDQPRQGIARLHPDGTIESTNTFAVSAEPAGDVRYVFGLAQQADARILRGGFVQSGSAQLHARIARLDNGPATQKLTIPSHQHIEWLRSGAVPQVGQVTFEHSMDGITWSLLGQGTRPPFASETEPWICGGLDLVSGGWVRARGRTIGGNGNASSGLIEQIVPLEFVPEIVVELPFERSLTNGSTQSLGAAMVNAESSLSFYIRNIGNAVLTDVDISIDGPDVAMFTVTVEPDTFIEPNGAATAFTVTFSPTSMGVKTATLRIASNDADENPFDIVLAAHGQSTPVAGSVDPTFAPELSGGFGYAQAAAVQPDGKIIVGGNFSFVNGEPRRNLARLNADGSVESTDTFNPGAGVDGDVRCMAVQSDGKILVGGSFGNVDGQERRNIARLNADGTLESTNTFNPGFGTDNQVIAMAVQPDGKILLAGNFGTVSDEARGGIARLHPDGTLEDTVTFNPGTGLGGQFPGAHCVAVQADGKVLLAGDFTSVDGEPRHGIARLHPDGTLESTNTFNPGTGLGGDFPAAFSLAVQADGKILLGGYFTSVDGQPRNRIARLNADGSVESTDTFNPGTGAIDVVNSIALQADGKVLLAGNFSTVNDLPRSGFARLHPDGTVESTDTFNPGTGAFGLPNGVTVQADGKILLVGSMSAINEQPRTLIARLANDVAIQTLTISNRTRIDWFRGGAAPEVEQVTFEISTNGGGNWTLAGVGARVGGGWECTGLSLPAGGLIRVRGRAVGATFSGSSGLVEELSAFSFVPELVVEQPLNMQLANGGTHSFGTVALGGATNLTFTIRNTGAADLTGLVATIDGPDAAMFTMTFSPTAPVAGPDGSTTFTVRFAPTSPGPRMATLRIENNDPDENPFDLILTGTMQGSRGALENILAELIGLRATVTNKHDGHQLDDAIKHLGKSLESGFWADETHLERKHGEKVFHEAGKAVRELCDLSKGNQSGISDAVLQGFIDRIVQADRLLASIAIDDAVAAGVATKKIDHARKHLAKGDADATDNKCDRRELDEYGYAWKNAARAKVSPPVALSAGRMQLEILGEPGERFTIQASSNLVDWVTIGTGKANAEGVVTFEDPQAGQHPARYYRVVSQ